MPDIAWNQRHWKSLYNWVQGGEEMSSAWGTSSAEWFTTIMPRIGSVLPARSVLEIGQGFGRWTEFLLRFCGSYCGIDLAKRCVDHCQQRFADHPNAEFFVNDGKSLEAVAGRKFDLVFSFDTLVHADLDVMSHYVPQIVQLLAPGGVAFLHHSNMAACRGASFGYRAEDVSAGIVGDLIRGNGGRVLVQERIAWGARLPSDCFSLFCRAGDHRAFETQDIPDHGLFAAERRLAREQFQHYLRVSTRESSSRVGSNQRKPGISFIVRVRNEEKLLADSLRSLQALKIPHEIVVILHRCTDRSGEIARSFPGVRVFEFNEKTSRAGFENLVTPAASRHSLVYYYDWCFSKAEHLWCFKWDADSIASPELTAFLNSRQWDAQPPTRILIPKESEGSMTKSEPYLFNTEPRHSKWVFVEHNASVYGPDVREINIEPTILHLDRLSDQHMKPYWREPPWFESDDSEEAIELRRKYRMLVELIGPEPVGLARDANPIREQYFAEVRDREEELHALGIELWR